MVGIVYATRREAAPLLARMNADALSVKPFETIHLHANDDVSAMLTISGMGKVAAAMAAAHLILVHQVSALINPGLCGSLTTAHDWGVGDVLRIDAAVEGDCDRFGQGETPVASDAHWFQELPVAHLVTCDKPVFDRQWRDQLADLGDVADMEGAAVARVAHRYGIPCALIKGISDGADEAGRRDVARHMQQVSERIADIIALELAQHCGT
jgi:adenosylhomocysteine nucleosidase